MTFGSLFAGIGGFDLGLERAGMTCKWQVEIDPFCRRVLAKHWPDVKRYEDVRDVGAHNLERVDCVAGGFPCQDVSESGKREGIEAERSGLWREMFRVIGELRPRYVLVENVTGLLSLGMGRVLGDLASIGYDSEWDCLSSCAFGAPHTRERVFVVAYPDASGRGTSWPSVMERVATDRAEPSGQSSAVSLWPSDWASEPGISRVVDGVPDVVDRGASLGNSISPPVAEFIGRRLMESQ